MSECVVEHGAITSGFKVQHVLGCKYVEVKVKDIIKKTGESITESTGQKDSLNGNQGQERGGGEDKNVTAYVGTAWMRLAQDRCR